LAAKALAPAAVKYIAVHCSASKPDQKVDASTIARWHRERGFLKIGYHFVILPDGRIQSGRNINEIGAHVQGFNSSSIGVCLVGGLDAKGKSADTYTASQKKSLAALVNELLQHFPGATVQGHRDFPNVKKDCPCFDVKGWWAKEKRINT
jgi:N-acetylmuramoyl-L-alanine amidase